MDEYCALCNKNSYATEQEAKQVAAHQRMQTGQPLYVYFGDQCGVWHLTSTPRLPPFLRDRHAKPTKSAKARKRR